MDAEIKKSLTEPAKNPFFLKKSNDKVEGLELMEIIVIALYIIAEIVLFSLFYYSSKSGNLSSGYG